MRVAGEWPISWIPSLLYLFFFPATATDSFISHVLLRHRLFLDPFSHCEGCVKTCSMFRTGDDSAWCTMALLGVSLWDTSMLPLLAPRHQPAIGLIFDSLNTIGSLYYIQSYSRSSLNAKNLLSKVSHQILRHLKN